MKLTNVGYLKQKKKKKRPSNQDAFLKYPPPSSPNYRNCCSHSLLFFFFSLKVFYFRLKNEQLPHCSLQDTQYSRIQCWSFEEMYTPQFLLHAFLLERYCLPKRNVSSTGKTIFPINLRKPKIPNGIKIIFPLPPP